MPGGIYGPGDTSQLGEQIRWAMTGKLRYVSFPTLGNAGYVDDIAAGLLLAAEKGGIGESYILGGGLRRCGRSSTRPQPQPGAGRRG